MATSTVVASPATYAELNTSFAATVLHVYFLGTLIELYGYPAIFVIFKICDPNNFVKALQRYMYIKCEGHRA